MIYFLRRALDFYILAFISSVTWTDQTLNNMYKGYLNSIWVLLLTSKPAAVGLEEVLREVATI